MTDKKEKVNHPAHYNQGRIEVIDAIEDWDLNFCEGNVVKYVARHRFKDEPLEDLKKARWYIDRLITKVETELRQDEDVVLIPTHDLLKP